MMQSCNECLIIDLSAERRRRFLNHFPFACFFEIPGTIMRKYGMRATLFYGFPHIVTALSVVKKRHIQTQFYILAVDFLHHGKHIFVAWSKHWCMVLQGQCNS